MGKVARLPVAHRLKPHCDECGEPLLVFSERISFLGLDASRVSILALTFRVRCACGAEWEIERPCEDV